MEDKVFELEQDVSLSLSGEKGKIIGVAVYTVGPAQHYVRYVAADGRQVEGWFDASAIN